MTNDPIHDHWRELSWRNQLSKADEAQLQAWLTANPEARVEWETEARLNAALDRLPDVPVPSNFTARVLQAVQLETAAEARRPEWRWISWLRLAWVPKVALAATTVCAAVVSCFVIQDAQRKTMAESVAAVSAVSSLPSPDILKDFDAIRAANPAPLPDETLLAVLQ
jgi:anti-sigma factor RsiW